MAAELAKLRSLPTPRWTAIGVLAAVVLAFIVVISSGSTTYQDYVDAGELPMTFAAGLGSMVMGVWVVGVEYGQGTVRRALTADPRRSRLVRAKLTAAVGSAVVLTLGAWLLGLPLMQFAAAANDVTSVSSDITDAMLAALFTNVVYATIGAGIALLVRSMAGAMTIMLVLVFVVDSIVASISAISDVSLADAILEVADSLRGDEGDHEVARGLITCGLWMLVVTGGGWLLFTRRDVN